MTVPPPYTYRRRIYFSDTDAGGVVYHAAYLVMAEQARIEAMIEGGAPHAALIAEHGCLFMVRRVNLEYFRPARLDDVVTITTDFIAGRGATVTADQSFALADGSPCARLLVDLACVRVSSGRPARIPRRWQSATASRSGAPNETI